MDTNLLIDRMKVDVISQELAAKYLPKMPNPSEYWSYVPMRGVRVNSVGKFKIRLTERRPSWPVTTNEVVFKKVFEG